MLFNAKLFLYSALLAVTVVNAEPVPEDRRQVNSIVNSLTSDVGSVFTDATSFLGSLGNGVYGTVTSVGGSLVTVITSDGGKAITLAGSAGGVVTSFAGHEYTIATSAAGSATSSIGAGNSGAVSRSLHMSDFMLGLAGLALGAAITFA